MIGRLIAAELLDLRTVRTPRALLVAAAAFAALAVAGDASSAGSGDNPALTASDGLRSAYDGVAPVALIGLVLGVLLCAGEYRHRTVTAAFLAVPRRWPIIVAKIVAAAIGGVVLGLTAAMAAIAVAWPFAAAAGATVPPIADGVPRVLGGLVLACVLYAVLGVGLGALLRNQVAALTIGLLWATVVEGLVIVLLPDIGRWTVGGAVTAVLGGSGPAFLAGWAGALLLAGYGAVASMVATATTVRRDVV